MYNGNEIINAVSISTAATLANAPINVARFAGGANTAAALPATMSRIAYPSIGAANGGTFLGSARPSTRGPGTGEQNDRTGVAYTLTTNAAGNIVSVVPVTTRPDGILLGGATNAPINPGVGPNIGAATNTIIFDTACLNTAFGVQTPAITGSLTATLVAADFQIPQSGDGAAVTTPSIYTADPLSGGDSFNLLVGVAGTIKVELARSLTDNPVTMTVAAGILGMQIKKVYTDGVVTATGLVALY